MERVSFFLENKNTKRILFFAGLAVVMLAQLPFIILGVDSVVPYHDQLDGELIAYIYQAKYLFSGDNVIPEFLGGAAKTALIPPAPLAVLLFSLLPPFAAYVFLQAIGQVTAYAGMFFMADILADNGLIAWIVALLYAFLPFLPIYGLSQYGIPLLAVSVYLLYRGEHRRAAFGYVAFYSLMSSLVLCGFACILLWLFALVFLGVRGKLKGRGSMIWGLAVMAGIYLLENLSLVFQVLGIGRAGQSHKSEYSFGRAGFWGGLWDYLRYNAEHSEDFHLGILCLSVVVILLLALFYKRLRPEIRRSGKFMLAVGAIILAVCVTAAFWESGTGVSIREHMGALGAFQLNRVLWLAPVLWYGELALAFRVLWSFRGRIGYVLLGISLIFSGWMGVNCLKNSLVKPCVQVMLQADYQAISWSDYLALGVMEQVEQYMREAEGKDKEEYKVASLGIDPAAALYQGFYCVDGYSNNYDLEYKHRFRNVIAPELEQNEWLREYYDGWGNRCYLFSAEVPGYYTIEKGRFWYNNLRINTEALKSLGCGYILSAAYIVNAEEEGLRLLREEPFETEDSYYRIYLYKIESE